MSVENSYPWAGGLHAADRLTPGSDVKLQSKGDSGVKESHGLGSKTFVLFVKLPNWKQHNEGRFAWFQSVVRFKKKRP